MSKEKVFTVLLLVALLGVSAFVANEVFFDKGNEVTKDEQLLQVITENIPTFMDNDKPVIKIESVSTYGDKWHIVTIKSLRPTNEFVPVKLIMLNSDSKLRIISGPDTHFAESELLRYNVPDSVILELQKE